MCGIAGIIGKNANETTLDAMLESQKHRGPDARGQYFDPGFAALGHNRLSIIDLAECSNQPFHDVSGRYVLVFNGEIYNYLELREKLKAHYVFKTQSDTEVLLAAWIFWGKACLDEFNGMFSFAIWDNLEKTLFAVRDRFGVKPFNYAIVDDTLYFASEIKAIHAAGIEKSANEKVWASYFVYGSYGNPDETFWNGIKQLPAGHWLEFKNKHLTLGKWYDFVAEVAKQPQDFSYQQSKEHYIELLKDSIALRFRADVNVGFNISGGLDSSVLLAMVNDYSHWSSNINAYTFYCDDPNYDELHWAEMMISETSNPLHKVLLQPEDVPQLAAKIALHQDEPFGGIPTLAYAKVFEKARAENVIVLLDGQGMDEQWAGYDYYAKKGDDTIQGVTGSPFKPEVLSKSFLALAEKPDYPKPFDEELLNKQYRDLFYTKITRALRFNDRVSMASSTELREPFLDHRLVEFAFSRPPDFKIKDGIRKWLLRDIASEYLSDNLVFAPKRPLQTPQREWLGEALRGFVSSNISQILHSEFAGWFDHDELHRQWQHYLEGNNQSAFHIWQWVGLGLLSQRLG